MRRRRWAPVALVLALALSTPACATGGKGEDGGTGSGVRVVASFYPLAEAARRVGGSRVSVTNLTPPGLEPHDIELTPRQVDELEDADVVLFLGRGFQPAVEQIVERSRRPAVDLLAEIGPGARSAGARDADEHQNGDGAGPDDGPDGQTAADPHVWLDPLLLARMADRVQAAFIEADPDGAADFAANTQSYRADLEALDARYNEGLARCQRRDLVTTHAAFHYLAARYRLDQRPITGLAPESEPDPGRLAELTDLIRDRGITTVFYEELVPRDLAETLAREAGVKTAVLNPLEGLTADEIETGADYFSVMEQNLRTLRQALGCP